MQGSVGIIAAFAAGVVSFLSPCVLPLLPAYLSFITGYTPAELSERRAPMREVLVPSLLFVMGFSIVFVALGASASVLGSFMSQNRDVITRVAGAVVLLLGFFMLGIVRMPWLYGEARFDLGRARSFGRGAAFIMGAAFAFGWTPCVGPILGSILALAGSTGSVTRGVALLLAYSMGLAVPFVAVAVLFGKLRQTLSWLNRHALAVNRVAGLILMAVGALMLSGQFSRLAGWLTRVLPVLEV